MTANKEHDHDFQTELEQEHEEIARYLRVEFGPFVKRHSHDYDEKGNRKPFFRQRDKRSLMQFFDVICDSFGRSYRELSYDKKLGDPSATSRNVKRLNYFLKEFCIYNDIDNDHPIQLFSYHEDSGKIHQVNFHFACARVETAKHRRTYSTDNIELSEAIARGQRKKQEGICTGTSCERPSAIPVVKYLHAVPPDPHFVGRRKQLEAMNGAWDSNDVHLVSIISWGGFGKSVLVRQWLEEMDLSSFEPHKPEKVLWWSFYQNNSVDAFLDTALSCLANKTEQSQRLYHAEEGFDVLLSSLSESPGILVLDGFEDMQYSQAGDYFGKCKSYQLKNFVRRICEGDCPTCLCVITSRLSITDLVPFNEGAHLSIDLEKSPLCAAEARSLLQKHGVKGDDELLDEIVQDHGGHPLALVTVSTLLSNFFGGDGRKAWSMPSVTIPKSVIGNRFKLWRTFSWYDSLLSSRERYVLRAISLFRQIAPWKLLVAFVQSGNVIETAGSSQGALETELRAIAFHLSQLQLIKIDTDSDTCFMHPLWRAFFEFSSDEKAAIGHHKMLFEILQAAVAHQPNTLQQMWPLIEAVYHGCKCGETRESLRVFRERIERKAGYLTKNLAAWETKVDLCSMFFSNKHFSGQCLLDDLEEQSHLLNAAGFAYMNLGLPVKAIPLYDRAAETCRTGSLQGDEGQVQRNRADAFLRLGRLSNALHAAQKALELDRSSKAQQSSFAYLGYVYALLGSFDLAESAFSEAVLLWGQDWLPPIRGVQFVEMLIMKGQYEQAIEKAKKMLEWTRTQKILFSEAECLRVLAVALGESACVTGNHHIAQEAIALVREAAGLASKAGVHYYMIRTILDSARIILSTTTRNMNTLEASELEHVDGQIHQVLRTSKESSYRLVEAEASLARTHVYLLGHDRVHAREELARTTRLARSLEYQWLEDKCSQLQKRL